MHKRLKEAEEKREENKQEMEQLHILEEYAAMVARLCTIWMGKQGIKLLLE